MRLPGFLRRGWGNPLNRRKQKPELRYSRMVAVPEGKGRKKVIPDRRRGRKSS